LIGAIAIRQIPPDHFKYGPTASAEAALRHLVTAAERGGEMGREDVLARAASGQLVVLAAFTGDDVMLGAAGGEVFRYPRCSSMCVTLLGGSNLEAWLAPLVTTLDDGCRKLGIERLEVVGRPGWARALKPFADEMAVLMVREVLQHVEGSEVHADHGVHAGEHPAGVAAGDGRHPEQCHAGPRAVGADPAELHRAELHRAEPAHAAGAE